jgi:hypothetical protein
MDGEGIAGSRTAAKGLVALRPHNQKTPWATVVMPSSPNKFEALAKAGSKIPAF